MHACVPEWVSLLLPLSDGFGLNNVIIKVFPELLPCLPPVTPLPAINQLPESCKSHGVSVCLSKCVCVSAWPLQLYSQTHMKMTLQLWTFQATPMKTIECETLRMCFPCDLKVTSQINYKSDLWADIMMGLLWSCEPDFSMVYIRRESAMKMMLRPLLLVVKWIPNTESNHVRPLKISLCVEWERETISSTWDQTR